MTDKKISPEEARKIAKDIIKPVKKNKAETLQDYHKKYDRIKNYGLPFHDFVNLKNYKKASYYAYKAAYQIGLASDILRYLSQLDIAREEDKRVARQLRDQISDYANQLINLKSDYTRQHIHEEIDSEYQGKRTRAVGHRKNIIGLPTDWRKNVLDELLRTKNSHYSASIVAMLTGCRPHELLNGIKVKIDLPGRITFVIQGAKVTERTGQPERILVIDTSCSSYAIGIEECFQTEGINEDIIKIKSKDSFQKAVTRAAKRVGFKKVTPYSFRNQFSADLKADGWDRVSIALALGHINDRTQQVYGAVNQGKGKTGLLEVSATRPVKEISGSAATIEERSGNIIDSATGDLVPITPDDLRPK